MNRWILPTLSAILLAACGHGGAAPVYDQHTAFQLASLEVPPGAGTFFLFQVDGAGNIEHQAKELSERLQMAAKNRQVLTLMGPDAQHNQMVLQHCVHETGPLPGLRLVVVGPDNQRRQTHTLAATMHAKLRYVVYP